MRNVLIILALIAALASPSIAQIRSGSKAPSLELETVEGQHYSLQQQIGSTPIVLWFADGSSSSSLASGLVQAVKANNATLVVVSLGKDANSARLLRQALPNSPILVRPSVEAVTAYVGTYIPGVSPRKNVFVVGRDGRVKAALFWPGVTHDSLRKAINQ